MDNKAIKKFVKMIKKSINLKNAILFGSRARGDNLITSDVDIILVSEDFSGQDFLERAVPFLKMWREPIDLELICYTPEEFKKKLKQIGLIRKAVREGIELS